MIEQFIHFILLPWKYFLPWMGWTSFLMKQCLGQTSVPRVTLRGVENLWNQFPKILKYINKWKTFNSAQTISLKEKQTNEWVYFYYENKKINVKLFFYRWLNTFWYIWWDAQNQIVVLGQTFGFVYNCHFGFVCNGHFGYARSFWFCMRRPFSSGMQWSFWSGMQISFLAFFAMSFWCCMQWWFWFGNAIVILTFVK